MRVPRRANQYMRMAALIAIGSTSIIAGNASYHSTGCAAELMASEPAAAAAVCPLRYAFARGGARGGVRGGEGTFDFGFTLAAARALQYVLKAGPIEFGGLAGR